MLTTISACFFLLFLNGYVFGQDSQNGKKASGDFGIYLLSEKNIDVLKTDIRALKLRKKPIVSFADILSYSESNYLMVLTYSAYKRLMDTKDTSLSFVVCVGTERIYAGSVWCDILSASFGGVVLLKQPFVQNPYHRIRFDLGYPTPEYFVGTDLRNDPRILRALEKRGKLTE